MSISYTSVNISFLSAAVSDCVVNVQTKPCTSSFDALVLLFAPMKNMRNLSYAVAGGRQYCPSPRELFPAKLKRIVEPAHSDGAAGQIQMVFTPSTIS